MPSPPEKVYVSHYKEPRLRQSLLQTYLLDFLGSHRLIALQCTRNLEDLATVDQAVAGSNHTVASQLVGRQEVEFGLGNSLGQDLLCDAGLGNTLQGLDSLLGARLDCLRRTGDLNGQETSVGVSKVLGHNSGARRGSRSLGKKAETRRPLNAGLATEQGGQDSNVGLIGGEIEPGETNDQSVGASQRSSLLAAVVLGGLDEQLVRAGGRSWHVPEEGIDPLGQAALGCAVGDDRDVGLSVDGRRELGNGVLAQVGAERGRAGGVDGGAQALVKGNSVGVVKGLGEGVMGKLVLLQLQ